MSTKQFGFTLIELILVLTVSVSLMVFTVPVGINFIQDQSLDESGMGVLTSLRSAQSQAFFQKNDSSFGVKFFTNSYIIFQGNTYASRVVSEDEVFTLSSGVSLSGLGEIVFSKITGVPSVTGLVIVASGSRSQSVDVNSMGKIERE